MIALFAYINFFGIFGDVAGDDECKLACFCILFQWHCELFGEHLTKHHHLLVQEELCTTFESKTE